jgi:pimeloyl-ACP methyl ester carboxylesterase
MHFLASLAASAALLSGPAEVPPHSHPTILLVHGAFADASSWNRVIACLEDEGHRVIAVANPLRGVGHDSQYLADIVNGLDSPVVLVGHSYGGAVISEVTSPKVRALVYVAGFAPDAGETALGLSGKFPGSTLGAALARPIALAAGGHDLYIQQARFHEQFAADVPPELAVAMAAGQRPVTEAALNEPARAAAWKTIPSWHIYGEQDRNIPPPLMAYMAERARSRRTEAVPGASHAVMISHPEAVARMILRAVDASGAAIQARR